MEGALLKIDNQTCGQACPINQEFFHIYEALEYLYNMRIEAKCIKTIYEELPSEKLDDTQKGFFKLFNEKFGKFFKILEQVNDTYKQPCEIISRWDIKNGKIIVEKLFNSIKTVLEGLLEFLTEMHKKLSDKTAFYDIINSSTKEIPLQCIDVQGGNRFNTFIVQRASRPVIIMKDIEKKHNINIDEKLKDSIIGTIHEINKMIGILGIYELRPKLQLYDEKNKNKITQAVNAADNIDVEELLTEEQKKESVIQNIMKLINTSKKKIEEKFSS